MKRRGINIKPLFKIGFGAILFCIIILITGYFLMNRQKTEISTGSVEKITLAAYAGDTGLLVYVAKDQGFFNQNNLDVTINDYEAGKLAADALINHKADICTATDFVFVSNSFKNKDLRVFGTAAAGESNAMIARRDKGISDPKDFKGKKIAVTRKSTGEFYLEYFLIFNGVSLNDVEIVDLNPGEIVDALVSGEIDGGFTWDPNIHNIKTILGDNAIIWPGQSGQKFYFVLIASTKWITKNPVAAQRFLRSLLQAEEFIKEQPEKAKEIAMKKFGYSKEYIDYSFSKHTYYVRIDQPMLVMFEDQARWRINRKLTAADSVPNYLEYINMDILSQVKPEAVRIIR